jgi:putative peptide zinc metalloprotease protein
MLCCNSLKETIAQPQPHSAGKLAQQWQSGARPGCSGLLHNYLFFRLPLVKPDRWLGRWAPRLEFLFSNHFLWLSMLALIAGLWGVSRSWEVHVHPGGLAQPGKDYLPMA